MFLPLSLRIGLHGKIESDSEIHIHWKGAAEIVLASCKRYIDANGHLVPTDDDQAKLFRESIEDTAVRSLSCVAFAFRSCEMEEVPTIEEELEHWNLPEDNLVDPCRPGVRDAVQLCKNAGMKVFSVFILLGIHDDHVLYAS
ncbi:hypothetical protein LguiA_033383 [Lonicera macranthoides]